MKKTSRGFNIFSEFKDSYRNTIRVQRSSSAMRECCWIFVHFPDGRAFKNDTGEIHTPTAHLTKAQARRLIKALSKFVGDTSGVRDEGVDDGSK